MKIWAVEVSRTLYVLAADRDEAIETALLNERDEDFGPEAGAYEIARGSTVPAGVAESLPWVAESIDTPEHPVSHYLTPEVGS